MKTAVEMIAKVATPNCVLYVSQKFIDMIVREQSGHKTVIHSIGYENVEPTICGYKFVIEQNCSDIYCDTKPVLEC